MKIFVTGASGFVGGAAAKHFTKSSEVLAMSRSQQSDAVIAELGVNSVRCSLADIDAEHLAGVDAIIHAAAKVEEWGPWAEYWEQNLKGTERLLAAAKTAGVKTFVHIGTEAAVFHGQEMKNINETEPLALKSPYPYARTKAHAEAAVLAANEEGFRAVSVRPRMIWGPNDKTILPVILDMIKKGRFMWVNNGSAQTSMTHIDNLVHGIDLALQKGTGGEAYFVTDEGTRTYREFFTALTQTKGVTPPDKNMPAGLASFLARIFEGIWRLFRISSPPPLTRFAADMIGQDGTIDISKIKDELGYVPVISYEEGLAALQEKA